MKNQPKIVLASSSPYRKELLQKICPTFESQSPKVDESSRRNEDPLSLSKRLAYEKAMALKTSFPEHLIIGSDQVAMLGDQQLTKPGDYKNCVQQLTASSGKIIQFYTSLCVLDSNSSKHQIDVDLCRVHMKILSEQEIENYVKKEQPFNCAASFKSEGLGIALFNKIEGDDPNALIGLPLIKLVSLLDFFGYEVL